MKKMLTIKETAKETGLSEYEIRTGIKQGRYFAIKVGAKQTKYMINIEDFFKHLKMNTLNVSEPTTEQITTGYAKLRKM